MCDAPASGCPNWSDHCQATHTQPRWRLARQQWAAAPRGPGPTAATGGGGVAPAAAVQSAAGNGPLHATLHGPLHALPALSPRAAWSCERLLKAIDEHVTKGVLSEALLPFYWRGTALQPKDYGHAVRMLCDTGVLIELPAAEEVGGADANQNGLGDLIPATSFRMSAMIVPPVFRPSGPGAWPRPHRGPEPRRSP